MLNKFRFLRKKGTRSLVRFSTRVTEVPIIFFEEEQVNEYWILAFFLSNDVSIRKNKYESSRKIHCYPLLFPAFPSRPALFFLPDTLTPASYLFLSGRASYFNFRGSIIRRNWRQKFLPFLSFVARRASNQRVSKSRKAARRKRRKRRCSTNISLTVRERERERFENKRNLRVRMSRGLVKRFSGTSQNFRVTCFPVPLSRIARFEYTEEETAKRHKLKGGDGKFEKKKEMEKKSDDRYTTFFRPSCFPPRDASRCRASPRAAEEGGDSNELLKAR